MSNYSKFSPVGKLVEQERYPPYPRGTSKFHDWLDEMENYCLNGYTAGGDTITGPHFFKLNFTKIGIIDAHGNKRPTHPYYVDSQREFYDKVKYCYENGRNLIGLKGRDKGWTYDVAALALWNMMMHEGASVMCLTPGGTSVAKGKFRAAYDMAYNNLEEEFRYPYLKNSSNKYQDQIIYGWKIKDEDTGNERDEGPMNTLDIIVAINSSVVRSGRQKLIIIEEFGEIEGPKSIVGVADANLREGAKKFGMVIAGGTSNHMNEKGFSEFRDIWYNPDELGFEKIFIPAQKAYWGYVNLKTGVSDQEGAREHKQKERDKKTGQALIIEKQENPFDEKEAFYKGQTTPFNLDKINEQTGRVLSNKNILNAIQRGNLYPKLSDGVIKPVWELSDQGKWLIFKHPDGLKDLKNWVVGGVDSYRLGDNVADSDSKGAIELYIPEQGISVTGGYPCLTYLHREEDKEKFFMDVLLTAIYYSTEKRTCKMLIEYTDEDIITFFRQHAALKYLKERPQVIPQSQYSKVTNKYGIHPTQHNRATALEYAIKDFNRNWDLIVFVDLLDEMSNFGTKNTDRVWAHNWAVAHAMDNVTVLEEYKKPVKPKPFSPYTAVGSDGRIVVIDSLQTARRYGLVPPEVARPKEPNEART